MVAEACRIGLVNGSLSEYGGVNGSSLINGLLYYLITPILNMDILTKDQMQEMTDVLSQDEGKVVFRGIRIIYSIVRDSNVDYIFCIILIFLEENKEP